MGQFSAREVAAAILLEETEHEGYGLHYTQITDMVVASGLSGLTEYGGVTPSETLSRDMRERPEIFARMDQEYPDEEHPQGFYIVRRANAQRNVSIMEAKEAYVMLKQASAVRVYI